MGESEKIAYNPKLRGKLQEAGEVYLSIYIHNAKSKLRTFDDWKQERQDFYKHYKEIIEEAISYYYKDNKWQFGSFRMKEASLMLDAYISDNELDYNLTTGESLEERRNTVREEGDSKAVKVIKERKLIADAVGEGIAENSKSALNKNPQSNQQRDISEGNKQELEHDNLNENQMKGLHDISGWLYRNTDDIGMLGNSAYDFVHLFVEKQPARIKLLAYYLVEKKKRKAPDIKDVYESQTSYIPNLKEFKNQMIATKFKFWKRVDGSHIYWDKLGESMRIALNAQGIVADFASLSEMEHIESQTSSDTEEQNVPEETTPLSDEEQQIREAAKNRRIYYAKVVRCGFELVDLVREQDAEKKTERKVELSGQINAKSQEFKDYYMSMREADQRLVEFRREEDASRAGIQNIHGESTISAEETKTNKAAGYIGIGATAVDFSAKGFQHFSKVEMIGWGIAQADVTILNKISTVLSSVSLLTSFVSTIVTVCDWMNHSDRVSASECLAKTADLFASLASVAESGHRITMAAKGWSTMANFTLGAVVETNATSMGVVSAVTGGITAGVGATKAGIGLYRMAKVKSTEEKLEEQQANMTEQDHDTAEGILGLQKRIAKAQATAGAFQAAAGTLHMVGGILNAAGVTLMVGTMVSMAGTVVGLVGSIVKFMQSKSNINDTIDTYLQIDKYLTPIQERIQGSYDTLKTQREERSRERLRILEENRRNGTELSEEEEEEPESEEEKALKIQIKKMGSGSLREQIRIQAAAMAGYPSKGSFYHYIIEEYARFLYSKVFYKDGELILADSDEAKDPDDLRKLYIRMLHNSGLKPVYPVKRTDKPKPSLENIARKLKI